MKARIFRMPVAIVAVLVIAGGCAQQRKVPAPMTAPAAAVSLAHFAGTPLSGARPVTGAVAVVPAIKADVEWIAVERLPGEDDGPAKALAPVGASARLVLATRDRQPVLSTSRLTSAARWASGEPAAAFVKAVRAGAYGQTAPLATHRTAIPAGVTLDTRAAPAADSPAPILDVYLQHIPPTGAAAAAAPAAPAPAPAAVGGGRAGPATAPAPPGAFGAVEVTLGVLDFAVPADQQAEPAMNAPVETKESQKLRGKSKGKGKGKQPAAPPAPAPPPPDIAPVLTRELTVLPPVKVGGGSGVTAVLVLPSPFVGSAAKGLVAVIRATPAPDDAPTQKLLATTIADVRRQGAAGQPTTGPAAPAEWPGYESALKALDGPESRRRALVYLASQTGGTLCGEVALSADEPTLQQLAADIRARAAAAKPPFSPEALGWMLDRACLEWCAKLSGENRLPPELSAVMSTYAGEAGRRPASLEELLRGSSSRAALEARLVSENMIYLEDSSPSARVRATDWLAARNRAPAGFDPLGAPRDRREALERALEPAPATQPAAPASP